MTTHRSTIIVADAEDIAEAIEVTTGTDLDALYDELHDLIDTKTDPEFGDDTRIEIDSDLADRLTTLYLNVSRLAEALTDAVESLTLHRYWVRNASGEVQWTLDATTLDEAVSEAVIKMGGTAWDYVHTTAYVDHRPVSQAWSKDKLRSGRDRHQLAFTVEEKV